MKLIIDMSKEEYQKTQDGRVAVTTMRKAILQGTPIPDNATNGDVFKAVFPKGADLLFGVNWWYKPYQKGGK